MGIITWLFSSIKDIMYSLFQKYSARSATSNSTGLLLFIGTLKTWTIVNLEYIYVLFFFKKLSRKNTARNEEMMWRNWTLCICYSLFQIFTFLFCFILFYTYPCFLYGMISSFTIHVWPGSNWFVKCGFVFFFLFTWKWGLETHLAICLKRGSWILTNWAGSITSRISSISPRNITWTMLSWTFRLCARRKKE